MTIMTIFLSTIAIAIVGAQELANYRYKKRMDRAYIDYKKTRGGLTPEAFLNNCTNAELFEVDRLIQRKKYQDRIHAITQFAVPVDALNNLTETQN